MVVVEGRKPHCWSYKQIGHLAKFCPHKDFQKPANTNETPAEPRVRSPVNNPESSTQLESPSNPEGCTKVTLQRRKKVKVPESTSPTKSPPPVTKSVSPERPLLPKYLPTPQPKYPLAKSPPPKSTASKSSFPKTTPTRKDKPKVPTQKTYWELIYQGTSRDRDGHLIKP